MQIIKSIIENCKEDAPVYEVIRGVHWTAVVSKHCGIASSMINISCPDHKSSDPQIGELTNMTVKNITEYCYSENQANVSLGMAALNSLYRPDLSKCSDINGISYIHQIVENKNISVIGHFPGLDKLKEKAKEFRIIEKNPQDGDYPEEYSEKFLPKSDIVIISSTTLLNHTLENILKLCKKNSIKMLLGPGTPMTSVLFDFGIDILSGSIVNDQETVLRFIKQGANFIQIKKTGSIRFVTMIKNYKSPMNIFKS